MAPEIEDPEEPGWGQLEVGTIQYIFLRNLISVESVMHELGRLGGLNMAIIKFSLFPLFCYPSLKEKIEVVL